MLIMSEEVIKYRVDIDIWKNPGEISFYTRTKTFTNIKDATSYYNDIKELPITLLKSILLLEKIEDKPKQEELDSS